MVDKKHKEFSTLAEFEQAILVTKSLLTEKIAKIRIFANYIIHISLDEQLFEKADIGKKEKAKLKKLLNTEVPVVIAASLHDKPQQILSMMLPGDEYDKKKEIREEFDKKIGLVTQNLITPQMRQRILLKEIGKNDKLDEIKWDVNIKCHDLEKGSIDKFQFATVQFIYNSFGRGGIPIFFKLGQRETKTVAVDMHLEDIEQLIDDLSALRDNLKKISI